MLRFGTAHPIGLRAHRRAPQPAACVRTKATWDEHAIGVAPRWLDPPTQTRNGLQAEPRVGRKENIGEACDHCVAESQRT